ncbi:exonuclease [Candidatus Bathyarchaeota archaeon]|nr:MAG: exonuclease [Candidatus Bathyarchaeota archaeon]
MKADVTAKGAVLLGRYVACDAFDGSMPLRVVTHVHADHMVGLRRSLVNCEKVLMTEATKDLIDVMRGPLFLMRGCVETLGYGKSLQYEEERVTFFRADHVLGAAQVFVEDAEGTRIVFTGDFRIDETPVLDADILVMEATYGSPSCKRSFGGNVRNLLVSLVKKGLRQGAVYVFGYHGKIQEVMQILHDEGVKVPFVLPEKLFHFSKVCERHGMRLGRLMLSGEKEAKELLAGNSSCVAFCHMASRSKVGQGCFRIYVSGWEFNSACRQISEKEYVIALSDHSDFDGLVEYVRRSKPKLVITDNFRAGRAERLAKEIRRHLGITAVALPKK